jgi:hypothetical protein
MRVPSQIIRGKLLRGACGSHRLAGLTADMAPGREPAPGGDLPAQDRSDSVPAIGTMDLGPASAAKPPPRNWPKTSVPQRRSAWWEAQPQTGARSSPLRVRFPRRRHQCNGRGGPQDHGMEGARATCPIGCGVVGAGNPGRPWSGAPFTGSFRWRASPTVPRREVSRSRDAPPGIGRLLRPRLVCFSGERSRSHGLVLVEPQTPRMAWLCCNRCPQALRFPFSPDGHPSTHAADHRGAGPPAEGAAS